VFCCPSAPKGHLLHPNAEPGVSHGAPARNSWANPLSIGLHHWLLELQRVHGCPGYVSGTGESGYAPSPF
jgi:hypothetical protein